MKTLLDLAQSPLPSVPCETTTWKAVEALAKSRSGALVATDGGRLVGIVSERDLVHRVIGAGLDPRATLVRDVMTPDPVAVTAGTSFDEAFRRMIARGVRHLVVVDYEERPVALLSLSVLARERMEQAAETIRILQDYSNDSLGG